MIDESIAKSKRRYEAKVDLLAKKINHLHEKREGTDNLDEKIELVQQIGKLNSDKINYEERLRLLRNKK